MIAHHIHRFHSPSKGYGASFKVLPFIPDNRNYANILLMIIKVKNPKSQNGWHFTSMLQDALCLFKIPPPQIYCFPFLLFFFQVEWKWRLKKSFVIKSSYTQAHRMTNIANMRILHIPTASPVISSWLIFHFFCQLLSINSGLILK